MAEVNEWGKAATILTLVSFVDVTGVTGVVAA
jgi:hypothetical protein